MTLSVVRRFATVALLLASLATLVSCAIVPMTQPAAARAGSAAESQRLHALFDAAWEADMQRFPEWATYVGDDRYGDRLHDASAENEAAWYVGMRRLLEAGQRSRRGPSRIVFLPPERECLLLMQSASTRSPPRPIQV